MPNQHIWTDRNQDGRKREVRATKFGGAWRFQAKIAGDLDWTYYDQPLPEDLADIERNPGAKISAATRFNRGRCVNREANPGTETPMNDVAEPVLDARF